MTDLPAPDSTVDPTSDQLTVRVNGRDVEVASGSTLAALLQQLGRHPQTVAVEHNGEIIARARFEELELAADDRLEIVQFVQGG